MSEAIGQFLLVLVLSVPGYRENGAGMTSQVVASEEACNKAGREWVNGRSTLFSRGERRGFRCLPLQ